VKCTYQLCTKYWFYQQNQLVAVIVFETFMLQILFAHIPYKVINNTLKRKEKKEKKNKC